ncbi:MAG TPA: metal-dependent hydrolase [Candidatus Angelobacter sp.]
MPTAFTHALVAGSLGQAGKPDWRRDWRFWYLAVLCSILPDIDVIGFPLGVRYGDLWGHRGMTHSLLFAAVIAVIMAFRFPAAQKQRWKLMLLLFVITASHGVLDAMTNGGLGVAFFSPFDTHRYFFPWTPIQVSPIGASGFFSARGIDVLWSEIVWIWGPAIVLGAAIWAIQQRSKALSE